MRTPAITALVTGVTGAVGSIVAHRLRREGYLVRALVRDGSEVEADEVVHADLGDREALAVAARGAGVAVHCAAIVSEDWNECRRTNIEGTRNLVDALLEEDCRRLVHVSTISVYDDNAGPDFDEASPIWTQPVDPYGFTKAEGERIVQAASARGLQSTILRPGLVLSMHPRSHWGPMALHRARTSSASILPFPEIPHVHVDNLADVILLAIEAPVVPDRVYNVIDAVGDGSDYLRAVYGAIGLPPPPIPPGAPRPRFAAERIRRDLGFSPADRWRSFLASLGTASPIVTPGPKD